MNGVPTTGPFAFRLIDEGIQAVNVSWAAGSCQAPAASTCANLDGRRGWVVDEWAKPVTSPDRCRRQRTHGRHAPLRLSAERSPSSAIGRQPTRSGAPRRLHGELAVSEGGHRSRIPPSHGRTQAWCGTNAALVAAVLPGPSGGSTPVQLGMLGERCRLDPQQRLCWNLERNRRRRAGLLHGAVKTCSMTPAPQVHQELLRDTTVN